MQDLYKVLAYVTRRRDGRVELLVFDHKDIPAAGVQVPAGTVEDGESTVAAAVRELAEESGLLDLSPRAVIDQYVWINPETGNRHHRHVYQFDAPPGLADEWSHQPTGGDEETKMIFEFFWLPIEQASTLAGEQGRSIHKLV